MTDVLCVAGARPNFMKIAPILHELDRVGVSNRLVHTGQHYDPMMSDVFFDDLDIRRPDFALEVGSGSHAVQTARIMEAVEPVLLDEQPTWLLVVGDVNSTVACSLVGAKLGVEVAHVEAGLRSRDWNMPEEVNRVVTDRLSRLLLAPSSDAVDNLRAEGYPEHRIELVGNVMIDSLLGALDRARSLDVVDRLGLERDGYALATLHRPSNVDDPSRLGQLVSALVETSQRLPVVWPVHPRVADRAALLVSGHDDHRLLLIEPVGYLESIALQDSARMIITDSGGVQEESTALGVACLTVRDNTERPITVTDGTNRVIGSDAAAIGPAVDAELAAPVEPRSPALWDGRAAERIVDALQRADTSLPMT